MDTKEKLTALRSRMKEVGVAALYVGTTDPHQTESVAAHWKSVQWLTGFTGSMGYAVVTADDAEFWTTDATRRRLSVKSPRVPSTSTRFPMPVLPTGMPGS